MKKVFLFFTLLFSFTMFSQEEDVQSSYTLSLEEAIILGLQNNYTSQIAGKEVEKALKQKWEIISQGLPQISANVDYQNLLKQPVTLLPAELAGGAPGTFVLK
ncbi:hypothetical protein [Antarcticibacterium sp. 1MA-6-2]|uniref:hypothetical protein n=1 Tax=Antarcticibacterium sp. 1MA-6-2 TaxID=2908210 RepID=UPI002882F186|nr:hypothetical protein [Antarcticibacterium sp. 1MA-6-2]